MFDFAKKDKKTTSFDNLPLPPTSSKMPPPKEDPRQFKAEDFVPEPARINRYEYPKSPAGKLAARYGVPESMVEEIMAETVTSMPPQKPQYGLTMEDYIQLYRLSSLFRENIWNFIKTHASNKQLGKLQGALSDLDQIDKITTKLSNIVPLEIKKEMENGSREI